MTLIIGHKSGWIVSDTMATWGGDKYRVDNKVAEFPGVLVGVSGMAKHSMDIRRLVEAPYGPEEFRDAAEEIDRDNQDRENGSSFLYISKSHFLVFDRGGYSYTPHFDFECIGVADTAMGYLYALQQKYGLVTVEDAIEAVKLTAKLRHGVSEECIVKYLSDEVACE